jgi:hypothetical protein
VANEIQSTVSVTITFQGATASGSASMQDTLTTTFIGNEQIIGTTAEVLDLGDVGADPIVVFVKNLDATNFVTVDSISLLTNFPQKLIPGAAIFLRPQTGTIYCKADTASCKVFVVAG